VVLVCGFNVVPVAFLIANVLVPEHCNPFNLRHPSLSLSQQPIYETLERISPTERDLMMKLEKSQLRVMEVSSD
jgi:hypothetical protein